MEVLARVFRRIWYLLNRRRLERDLEREMASHRALMAEPRHFGNPVRLREQSADVWGWSWLDNLGRDLRYSVRQLRSSPQFTIAAVLGLGLGLSVSSLTFSVVSAYLFRPLPVRDGGRLVALAVQKPTSSNLRNLSYPNLVDIRDDLRSFESVFAYSPTSSSVRLAGLAERRNGQLVTGNYFAAMGVSAHLGRVLDPRDDRSAAEPVVVISHALWTTQLASDPGIVGQTLYLNGSPFTVIGVAREQFQGIDSLLRADWWTPTAHATSAGGSTDNRDGNGFRVRGYLRSGLPLRQAQAEIDALAGRLRQNYPVENAGLRISIIPERRTRPLIDTREVVPIVGTMLIGVGIIVLINTCGSVLGLMLARSTERQREMSLRLALGATSRQVLGHTIVESLLIALMGGTLAWLVVRWAAAVISARVPMTSGYLFDVQADQIVFGFTLLVTIAAGVAIGVVPALAAVRTDIKSSLAGEGLTTDAHRSRARRRVIMVQFALVTVLLVTAGLFTGSANIEPEGDLGFATSNRILVEISPGDNGYDEARGAQLLDDVLRRASALPSVRSATLVQDVPLGQSSSSVEVRARDQPDAAPRRISYNVIGPGYFETMAIPIVRGRTFDAPGALAGSPAIVNERLASSYWPGQDPIGMELIVARDAASVERYSVIGVARDAKYNSVREAARGYVYLPHALHYRSTMVLVVHTSVDPSVVIPAIRAMIRDVDPMLPANAVSTLEASIATNALGSVRLGAGVLGVFGMLGTVLAVFGMFGLLSYTTRLQYREIGVRMALGATNLSVMQHLLGNGLTLAGKGMAAGLLVSLVVTGLLRGSLFGISALQPAPFVLVPILLGSLALAASYLSARRVLVGNPMKALGHE